MDMGRPKTVYLDLPPRMTGRTLKSGKVRYYYTGGSRRLPLGDDLNRARLKWAEYENGGGDESSKFLTISRRWEKEELHKLAFRTQYSYGIMLVQLRSAFGAFSLEQIRPMDIRKYLDLRSKKVAANREISLLSTIFNWSRERGITNDANPCIGIKKNTERPRGRYVTEEEYKTAWDKALPFVQDTMDLALLTGQRPSDILKMTRQDMRDGCLWVRQDKTGAKLRIRIEGLLESVLQRILARPKAVPSMYLISDDSGQKVAYWKLYEAFLKTGADWQFRDIRAKMVTDEPDLKTAQMRAGHRSEQTTATVYRRVKGHEVGPLKRG